MKRIVVFLGTLLAFHAVAHEVRPAYLELREESPGEFAVLFKTPMRGDMRLALEPILSSSVEAATPILARRTGDAEVRTWRVRTSTPLAGQMIAVEGLAGTMTDALVRLEFADGKTWVKRLTPQQPSARIPANQNIWSVAIVYCRLGVEHILLGIDHLLFVFVLLLVTQGISRLITTITAFTIAHSITLALATLGAVRIPSPPVEAAIALSIAFVAVEAVRLHRNNSGLLARAPWIAAFSFGLLHGFGFAGALNAAGLPEAHIPAALLFFNVGVELGQLAFIAAVLSFASVLRRIRLDLPAWTRLAPPYVIGSAAMFWLIQRVAAF